jgi:hypothetical protein
MQFDRRAFLATLGTATLTRGGKYEIQNNFNVQAWSRQSRLVTWKRRKSDPENTVLRWGAMLLVSGSAFYWPACARVFRSGDSGELRYHNLRPSEQMEVGFDADRDSMLVEIDHDQLYFQTISRTGLTIDSGVLQRQKVSTADNSQKWPTLLGLLFPAASRHDLGKYSARLQHTLDGEARLTGIRCLVRRDICQTRKP